MNESLALPPWVISLSRSVGGGGWGQAYKLMSIYPKESQRIPLVFFFFFFFFVGGGGGVVFFFFFFFFFFFGGGGGGGVCLFACFLFVLLYCSTVE